MQYIFIPSIALCNLRLFFNNVKIFHFSPESGRINAEVFCRIFSVPGILIKSPDYIDSLHLLKTHGVEDRHFAIFKMIGQVVFLYIRLPAENKGMLYDILQFADIAGIVMVHKNVHDLIADTLYVLTLENIKFMDKVFDQKGNVLFSFA